MIHDVWIYGFWLSDFHFDCSRALEGVWWHRSTYGFSFVHYQLLRVWFDLEAPGVLTRMQPSYSLPQIIARLLDYYRFGCMHHLHCFFCLQSLAPQA
jgi:hypothetical protein